MTSLFRPRRSSSARAAFRETTVQLFVTCLGDLLFPEAIADAEALLRCAGFDVLIPPAQVCCGQPAFNAGHLRAARRVARSFVRAFVHDLPIVAASGSCVTMASRCLPDLLGVPPFAVWELSAFLDAHGGAVTRRNEGRLIAYHDSCHMLRELKIADAPRKLLEASGAQLVPLHRADLCCGFGGTFSVRQPEISAAMADDKLASAGAADALVTADPGCLMQLRSRADARRDTLPLVHLATALARGVV